MKYIFFLTSVGPLYDFILPLIEKKKADGKVLIVATTDEAEQFFCNHTDYEVVRTRVNPNLITRSSKGSLFLNIIRSKFEYRRLFSKISGAEIYFFSNSFSLVMFSYLRKMSRNNHVIRCFQDDPDKASARFPIEESFRAYIMRWIAKWLMGVETQISFRIDVPVWQLDDKFYKNIDIVKIKSSDLESDKRLSIKLEAIEGKKILVTIQDLLEGGGNRALPDSFKCFIDDFMDVLDGNFSKDYVIKPHPRERTLYGKMAVSNYIIPAYIPSEFLMDYPWEFVIGLYSTSLISASRLTSATVISLMDLFDWHENAIDEKNSWKERMKKNGVLIPKDMDELKVIISKKISK